MAEAIGPVAGQSIIEVLPGPGLLTSRLLKGNPKHLVAVESKGQFSKYMAVRCLWLFRSFFFFLTLGFLMA